MKRIIVFLCFIFETLILVQAQDSVMVRKWVKDLSSPELHGRSLAYQGDSLAADYLRKFLINNNISPLSNDYYQSYVLPNYAMEGKTEVVINGRKLDPYQEYRIEANSKTIQEDHIPVIVFDPNIAKSPKKLTQFKEKHFDNIKKSVVYLDLLNKKFQKKDTDGKEEELFSQLFLYYNPLQALGYMIPVRELPVFHVSGNEKKRDCAAISILNSTVPEKWSDVSIHFQNRYEEHHTQNICAKIEGTQYPDSMILFTAHYDHVGTMGEVIFPGAHDNASGVSTVMALALHYLKNPSPYTTVFCFFSGEELGLKGSTYFVEHPLIDLKKVKMVVNIDLACGGNDGIMIVNSQADDTRWLYERFVNMNEEKSYIPEVKSRTNTSNSDHYPFVKNEIPAIFIYTLGGKSGGYHNYTDTNENCSLEKWEDIFHLIIDVMDFNN